MFPCSTMTTSSWVAGRVPDMMSKLMILCPASGQEVFTGIEIPTDTIAQIPEIVSRMICPSCNQEHAWTKKDARAVEAGSPTAPGKPDNR
jgi:hypothetical protein